MLMSKNGESKRTVESPEIRGGAGIGAIAENPNDRDTFD